MRTKFNENAEKETDPAITGPEGRSIMNREELTELLDRLGEAELTSFENYLREISNISPQPPCPPLKENQTSQ